MVRRLALLAPALALTLLAPVRAHAATTVVEVTSNKFTPAVVTVTQGNSVTWRFHAMHTSTSYQGFWDSGHRTSGDYVATFRDAGTFRYFCEMHPTSMKGSVRVPLRTSGRPAAGYTLRWTVRATTPSNRRYDVQFKKASSSTWQTFRNNTATRSAMFNPTSNGTYQLRARTRNVGVGPSGWTPVVTVSIS